MTRVMFDSTVAADVPDGSELVMGYVDGSSAWSDADWLLFPGRILVRICIFNNRMDAQVLDVEPGNCDALSALPWIRDKWLRGDVPTVYCFTGAGPSGYTISDVRAECDRAGVKRPLFLVTDFDNDPSTFDPAGDPEIIGKQYANGTFTGGHFDASVVADFWPGIDKEEEMPSVSKDIYIAADPSDGKSLEDRVKETDRVLWVAEFVPQMRAELAQSAATTEQKAVVEALLDVLESALKPKP